MDNAKDDEPQSANNVEAPKDSETNSISDEFRNF